MRAVLLGVCIGGCLVAGPALAQIQGFTVFDPPGKTASKKARPADPGVIRAHIRVVGGHHVSAMAKDACIKAPGHPCAKGGNRDDATAWSNAEWDITTEDQKLVVETRPVGKGERPPPATKTHR